MAWRSPDRLLRRKVAQLARLDPDDMRAVIEALEPDQRRRIEHLVLEEVGTTARRDVPSTMLSPWLVERIEGSVAQVTSATRVAIAQAASWPRSAKSPTSLDALRPSLVERGLAALGGARRQR